VLDAVNVAAASGADGRGGDVVGSLLAGGLITRISSNISLSTTDSIAGGGDLGGDVGTTSSIAFPGEVGAEEIRSIASVRGVVYSCMNSVT
jgi:hypothetical protein